MALQCLLDQRYYLKLQIHNKYTIALIADIQNHNFFILLKYKKPKHWFNFKYSNIIFF